MAATVQFNTCLTWECSIYLGAINKPMVAGVRTLTHNARIPRPHLLKQIREFATKSFHVLTPGLRLTKTLFVNTGTGREEPGWQISTNVLQAEAVDLVYTRYQWMLALARALHQFYDQDTVYLVCPDQTTHIKKLA